MGSEDNTRKRSSNVRAKEGRLTRARHDHAKHAGLNLAPPLLISERDIS
jgi:hypothetical protein